MTNKILIVIAALLFASSAIDIINIYQTRSINETKPNTSTQTISRNAKAQS